jgi:hypothetical protein
MIKEGQCRRARTALEIAEQQLAELEERGVAALSAYDREVPFGGDAERALLVSTRLVRNQRNHFAREVARCGDPVRQTTLFDATSERP